MLGDIQREVHYQYRSLRLALGFATGRFIHANLQVTYRCNFACQICDFWKESHCREEEMSLADVRVIGRKLNQFGTLIVSLAGGEPLIREDLCEIIRILNDAGHFPILITNGWYVNETLARDLSQAGLQEISVSVDYADAARHDKQRGLDGAWKRAIRALELLNHARPDTRRRVHMISVLMDDNLDDIERLIQLSRDLGVTYMLSLYSWNRGAKTCRLPDHSVTRHLLDLKTRYPEFVTLTSYIEQLDRAIADGGIGNCRTGRLLMNIDTRGNVSRCTEMLDQPVGNILTDDIDEIRGRLWQRQREQKCAQCWTSCRGFAESMMRRPRLRQFREFFHSVRPHPKPQEAVHG
ncbi:MAG: radical SAM/SPASM domain-containing protein [Tepidisphaerales bacterium]